MSRLRYITHPQVAIDADAAVDRWHLSAEGRRRAARLLDQPWVASLSRVVSSDEVKALETAQLLANRLGLPVERWPDTREIDRTATGYLPPEEYEIVADACFSQPRTSARGWERAADAQRRIVGALAGVLDDDGRGDVAVIGHGGVGTLWYCHLAGVPIDRRWDQPGQGHYFTVDRTTRRPSHHWRALDDAG